jgi:hypothetical protein
MPEWPDWLHQQFLSPFYGEGGEGTGTGRPPPNWEHYNWVPDWSSEDPPTPPPEGPPTNETDCWESGGFWNGVECLTMDEGGTSLEDLLGDFLFEGEDTPAWDTPPPDPDPQPHPGATEPEIDCIETGGTWNGIKCTYPPADVEPIYSEFDCIPGTMYTNAQGQRKYCGQDTDYEGLSLETAWSEQENPLLSILGQNPEFLRNFDMSEILEFFPNLDPKDFNLAQKGYRETLGGLRQESEAERRTMGDVLRGSAMESGQQLASSGFAGGGAYGLQGGKERKKGLRDYRQFMEDISLSETEADVGFKQSIEDIRFEYGEDVAEMMSSFLQDDPVEGSEVCEPDSGEILWNGVCTPIELTPFAEYMT